MGNINLNNYYKRRYETTSPVDRSLTLRRDSTDGVLYSDIRFDLAVCEIVERPLNARENDRDLQSIEDEESVLNSLKNILNTRLCSRILNPEAEVDLETFLFEPITKHKAYFIGYQLYMWIPTYEPRVRIDRVDVQGHPEEKTYTVDLEASIPSLGKSVKATSIIAASS